MPTREAGYDVVPRVGRTDFVEEWASRPEEARKQADRLRGEIMSSIEEQRAHELTPFTGQTAGLIDDVQPAGGIVRSIVAEAEAAIESVGTQRTG